MADWKEELGKSMADKGIEKKAIQPLTQEQEEDAIKEFYKKVSSVLQEISEFLSEYEEVNTKINNPKGREGFIIKSILTVSKNGKPNLIYEVGLDNSLLLTSYSGQENIYGEADKLVKTGFEVKFKKYERGKLSSDIVKCIKAYL